MVYALVLPLALMLGYLMASPTDLSSVGTVALVLSVIALPLILKWHYQTMLLSWNMVAVVFFLPGTPEFWLVAAFMSITIAFVQRAMSKEMRFISVPSLAYPLIFILGVVFVTARLTGGIGVRALGSGTFGGRGYIWILGGVIGFFAMTAYRIPREKASLCTALYLLGGVTSLIPTLVAFGPSELYNIGLIFPISGAELGKVAMGLGDALGATPGFYESIERFSGLTVAGLAMSCFLLARYGIWEMLSVGKLWRFALFVAVVLAGSLGGFRSVFLLEILTFLMVFWFEGLFRSKYLGIFLGVLLLTGALLVPLANKLPLSIQRAISVLPLQVDPIARYEAEWSTEWRVKLWQMLLPQVPRYFWLGKGLAVSGAEVELNSELASRGEMSSQEQAIAAGIYHSGPLTLLIPFGVWGAIGWVWFLAAAIRVLYLNHRYGDRSLRKINTFLLAFFLAKTVNFFFIFGDFRSDIPSFVGIVGLSVALNSGIRRRVAAPAAVQASAEVETTVPVLAG